jgi:5-methylcytosine-specific restriction endonuclease McrA
VIEATRIAQEANTIQQTARNLVGQTFTEAHAAKIERHVARIRALIKQEKSRAHLRLQVFAAYGGRCVCCGESNPDKLTLDHITPLNGRKRGDAYKQAIAANFPRDRFQVLCRKCNSRKGTGPACPCQQKEQVRAASTRHVARIVRLVRRE